MKKYVWFALACIFLSSIFTLTQLQAWNMPMQVNMNASKGKVENPMYTPVTFPHQKHVSVTGCPFCHHKWEDQSKAPLSCTAAPDCHHILNAQGEQMNNQTSAYYAYHTTESEKSCWGCHLAKQKAGNATGPTSCTKCHPCPGEESSEQ